MVRAKSKLKTGFPPNVYVNTTVKNIPQVDGLDNSDSIYSSEDDQTSDDNNATTYNTEDEIEPDTGPISITPPTKLNKKEKEDTRSIFTSPCSSPELAKPL